MDGASTQKSLRRKTKSRSRAKNSLEYSKLEDKNLLASVGFDGAGLGSADLTYYLGDAPADVGQSVFESTIEQALEAWSDVADINFTQTQTPGLARSLDFTFRSLDGSGGTLAQAFFPDDVNPRRIAGDVQFDTSENWEVGNSQGAFAFDLLHVAVHEVGHALGLPHEDTFGSVLNSTVSPNQQFTELDQSDIDAILELYAPVEEAVVTPTPEVGVPTVELPTPESPLPEVPTVDDDESELPADQPTEVDQPVDDQSPADSAPEDSDPDDDSDDEETNDPTADDPADRFRQRFNRFLIFFFRRFRAFRFIQFR